MGNALKSSIGRLASKLDDYKKDAQLLVVATGNLVPYAKQARTKFDEEALRELAESFKEVGILEPLLVRPIANNKFEIIAGERRLRAAIIAGLSVSRSCRVRWMTRWLTGFTWPRTSTGRT